MLLVQNLSLERLDKKIFENINFSLIQTKLLCSKEETVQEKHLY